MKIEEALKLIIEDDKTPEEVAKQVIEEATNGGSSGPGSGAGGGGPGGPGSGTGGGGPGGPGSGTGSQSKTTTKTVVRSFGGRGHGHHPLCKRKKKKKKKKKKS